MTEQLIYIAVMAVITYLIRGLPITGVRKEITSQWLTSFLYYVPYAVLAALTFPAIFTATGNVVTSTAGTLVALILAYFDTGLVIVAVGNVVLPVARGMQKTIEKYFM